MKRIDRRTVELTPQEDDANACFEHLLDRGFSVIDAANRTARTFPGLDPAFVAWLRDEDMA